jgi:hypothetical protein
MKTATAPNVRPQRHESESWQAPIPDLPEEAPQEIDAHSVDPTQGRKIGASPYDDPTYGRKIGAGIHDDPTRGR